MSIFKSTYSNIQVSAETVSRASDMVIGNIPIFDSTKRLIDSGVSYTGLTYNNGLTKINNIVSLGGSLTGNTKISGYYNLTLGDNISEINNFDVYGKTSLNNRYSGFNNGGVGFDNITNISAIQTDGKILVGGNFTGYNTISCSNKLTRLNTDGSIDNTFNSGGTGFNGDVQGLIIQTDGKILVGGNLTTYNGITCLTRLVRLNTDGSIDLTFNSGGTGFNNTVIPVVIQSDNKILVGGYFTTYNGITCSAHLVRLNTDGSIDNTFNSGGTGFSGGGYGNNIVIQPDNKILITGGIIYNSITLPNGITRLNVNGSLDNTFNSGGTGFSGGTPYALQIQLDNKILLGGDFTVYNGVSKNRIVRLNSDGSIDNTFNSGGTNFNDYVRAISISTITNKILVGGNFTTYNSLLYPARLVRLNTDGSIDLTFNSGGTGFNNVVNNSIIQTNTKILLGGYFGTYNGVNYPNYFSRLNADGSLDVDTIKKVLFNNVGALKYSEDLQYEYTDRSLPDVGWIKKYTTNLYPSFITVASGVTLYVSNIPIMLVSGGTNIILPNAVKNSGFEYTIKLVTTGSTTISTMLSQTIDGVTTKILSTQYQWVKVKSDGLNWYILS